MLKSLHLFFVGTQDERSFHNRSQVVRGRGVDVQGFGNHGGKSQVGGGVKKALSQQGQGQQLGRRMISVGACFHGPSICQNKPRRCGLDTWIWSHL